MGVVTAAPASVVVRPYAPSEAGVILAIFRAAVRIGARRDYSQEQVEAWAPDEIDFTGWSARRTGRLTWVAEVAGEPEGFTDLEPNGHLDMLYVHPDHHRRGVATALLATAEASARAKKLRRLYTEASLTARPAFEASGYRVIAAQTVQFNGRSFRNFRMEKRLA